MAYAGMTYKQLAAESEVTRDTLRAIMGKSNPHGGSLERLHAIADACKVPRRFMEEGFANLDALTLPEWAQHLEARMAELEARMPATPLAAEAADPEADLGRELGGESPIEEDEDQSDERRGGQT